MRFLFIVLLIGIFSADVNAHCSKESIKHINEYLKSFINLQAEFRQIDKNGKIINGKFYMKRPNHMKLEYDKPRVTLLYKNGSIMYYDHELGSLQNHKIHNFILRAILDGKIENRNLKCKSIKENDFIFISVLLDNSRKTITKKCNGLLLLELL